MITIDAKGEVCPIPVIKAKNALKQAKKDETVVIIVDNETSKENLEKMAREIGFIYSSKTINKEHYEVTIVKGLGSDEVIDSAKEDVCEVKGENTLVVISSNKMGEGSDELGENLMKSFVYALTEVDMLPSTVIFYNGGAKLSVTDSPVIDDLKKLEEQGVEILTCGTCLNYYGITEKLAVGEITNMYSIIEKMNDAHKIIKP